MAATNELHETCLATPAISEGTLFFRTREKLIAVAAGGRLPESKTSDVEPVDKKKTSNLPRTALHAQ